jgi:hypothetical protein
MDDLHRRRTDAALTFRAYKGTRPAMRAQNYSGTARRP